MDVQADFHDAFVPGHATFEDFNTALSSALITGTKASHQLPKNHDHDFHMMEAGFKERAIKLQDRLARLLHASLDAIGPEGGVAAGLPSDLDDIHDALSTSLDAVYERVDIACDEVLGAREKERQALKSSTSSTTLQRRSGAWNQSSARNAVTVMHAQNVQRPQLRFQVPVDNSATPFVPRLVEKPHASAPLDLTLVPVGSTSTGGEADSLMVDHLEKLGLRDQANTGFDTYCPHPYLTELNEFEVPQHQLQPHEERLYGDLEQTTCTWVGTREALVGLIERLKSVSELAIDLEAHSYRTYQGFTCLMQLSTRSEDYLIDTLALRDDLKLLNVIFADPAILKVLHGADSDILWLQRDHSLYIVNMFDTGQATRVLNFPRHSLAWLLQHYCNFKADKKYQLADWRVRPLSEEMLHYARCDTHFLLYIYDRLHSELLAQGNEQANLLRAVYQRSKELCLQRYEKPFYSQATAEDALNRMSRSLVPSAVELFMALHAWRDQVARDEDESPRYVLPDHMLLELASRAPTETGQILACCQPIPPLVRVNVQLIQDIILTKGEAIHAMMASSNRFYAADATDFHGGHEETVRRVHRFDKQFLGAQDHGHLFRKPSLTFAVPASAPVAKSQYKGRKLAAEVLASLGSERIFTEVPEEHRGALDHAKDYEARLEALRQKATDAAAGADESTAGSNAVPDESSAGTNRASAIAINDSDDDLDIVALADRLNASPPEQGDEQPSKKGKHPKQDKSLKKTVQAADVKRYAYTTSGEEFAQGSSAARAQVNPMALGESKPKVSLGMSRSPPPTLVESLKTQWCFAQKSKRDNGSKTRKSVHKSFSFKTGR
ncbi:uncharacterized protein MONBRDRAFT_33488 [Monosiga brevicollis MX1]|uniref:HRDC domain-containing protein n=1 Tax=Monosiga brevicollis TaxID=81824 RepID=A9V5N1_MONBE|nr:uncharacterized protein MONBRDRAFT_33488 [Monosiga brevicollis MX1]EDQ87070.1 predicted protein [Monosiga brevicollis MX1]|eukprot:XP_001748013.1 hypothetical protein [Monosiga brevicollis MX1]